MPIYEYQCDQCGIRDDKFWSRISIAQDTIPCKGCQADMRKLVSAASFTFSHASGVRGALPPSTGTSDDWNYDKAIGRDAEKKWGIIEARNGEKDKVIRQERENGFLVKRDNLVQTSEGGYRILTESERVRVNENRAASEAIAKAAAK